MKRKTKESKLNVFLTALLVVFVCLLSFSVGVISGKGWSDRDYKVKHIEQDSHLQMAQEDNAPIGDEMTAKEVELLTQKALREAKAQQPEPIVDIKREVATASEKPKKSKNEKPVKEKPTPDREESLATTDTNKKSTGAKALDQKTKPEAERKVSSLMPKPSVPAPKAIEYTVQVAAYKTIEEAEGHSQKLIDKGFPAFPVKAIINGDDWYRVSIGSFKNRTQAMKYEAALKKQAMVKSTFVQKISRAKEE